MGDEWRECVRYWESDGQTSPEFVKGKLKRNVQFWKEELMASDSTIRLTEEAYNLPLYQYLVHIRHIIRNQDYKIMSLLLLRSRRW